MVWGYPIHPVFPRHTLKGLDIFAGNLNVLNACALAYKLLYGLLAVVDFGVLGLRQILPNGPFQQADGQPAACFADLDGESHRFFAYFILHGKTSSLCRLGLNWCALRRNQQAAEQVFHAPASFPPHLVSTTDSPLAMPPQSLPAVSANSAGEAQMWSAPSIINSPGLAKRR